jgi:hypothetical protein
VYNIKRGAYRDRGFLRAVLENNLKEAAVRADDEAQACLVDIVLFIYNELPSICWGLPENVSAWITGSNPNEK